MNLIQCYHHRSLARPFVCLIEIRFDKLARHDLLAQNSSPMIDCALESLFLPEWKLRFDRDKFGTNNNNNPTGTKLTDTNLSLCLIQ